MKKRRKREYSKEKCFLTSVRYKLVLFPKEGKPCGRSYIELTFLKAKLGQKLFRGCNRAALEQKKEFPLTGNSFFIYDVE